MTCRFVCTALMVMTLRAAAHGRSTIDFSATDHYTWVYRTVLDRPRDVATILARHKLTPGSSALQSNQ